MRNALYERAPQRERSAKFEHARGLQLVFCWQQLGLGSGHIVVSSIVGSHSDFQRLSLKLCSRKQEWLPRTRVERTQP